MKAIYRNFKKGSKWAKNNKQQARLLSFLLQSIIIFSGLWMGWDMFNNAIKIPAWLPIIVLLICGVTTFLFTDNTHFKNGTLKNGQRYYMDRIARYSVYAYSTFLIAVCSSNFYWDNNHYKIQDVWADFTASSIFPESQFEASVSYNNIPLEKIKAPKHKLQKPIVKNKNKTNSYKGYLAVAIINLLLALACVVGACAGFCVGGALGIIGAVWAISSFIGCVGMSVVAFRLFGQGLRAEQAGK